ncbi:flagellar basal-body rod modification protein FlgD [Oceanisphaera litoralis]|uniref:flagellar hook assembly protein FlgD n=1 Tax=Oceanisphaera litoralis TaxID=225144 RepID=UPI00195D7C2B|nr:flagellar hook assembly protein FlgD [Oceanisphaera litoralis]MBM7456544.1 flagellar basal-body rod modification protein FlgD [Oceanisphaera litoralis]
MQVNNDYLNGLKWQGDQSPAGKVDGNSKAQLEQEDFFALLTQQLAYQDPFKPADNAQMVSQMTSFSTSEGINNMSRQLAGLNDVMTSNQALQASTLVGQKVLLPSNLGYWDQTEPVEGAIAVGEGAQNVKVRVEDEKGQLLREISLDGSKRGNVPFSWDGLKDNGEPAPVGIYHFKVNGLVNNKREDLNALMFGRVGSVTLGSGETPTLVNLSGLGGIPLSQVLEIAGRKSA